MTDYIPLNKLIHSRRNVRKTDPDEGIESLADSIHRSGQIERLLVSPAAGPSGKAQKYAVDVHGRVFRALRHNVKLKRIPPNHPVPCKIVDSEEGLELSLAENLQTLPLHPADEAAAFAAYVRKHLPGDPPYNDLTSDATCVANCAKRFGKTVHYVRRQLSLAAMPPDIFRALGEGRMTIDAAHAYASHPDHQAQLSVFDAEEKKPEEYRHLARSIRDQLAGKIYPVDHHAVVYVGLDAYRAAGGRIETDLFFGEGEREILLDPAIIDRLAKAKAQDEAREAARSEGWADAAIAPINGGSWSEPKPPKGFEKQWGWSPDKVAEDDRADRIVGYRVKSDGSGVEQVDFAHFAPVEPQTAAAQAEAARNMPDTLTHAAERRRQRIELRAAQIAAPSIDHTPLEGRALWVSDDYAVLEIIEKEGARYAYVELLVEVPWADVEAKLAEAESLIDREDAEELAGDPPESEDDTDGEPETPDPSVNDSARERETA